MKKTQQFKLRFYIIDVDYYDFEGFRSQNKIKRLDDFPKLSSIEEAYEINYKKDGWLFDDSEDGRGEEIYTILDCDTQFIAGDEVKILGDWFYILDRAFDLDKKIINYRIFHVDSNACEEMRQRYFDRLFKRIDNSFTKKLQSIFKNVSNGKD